MNVLPLFACFQLLLPQVSVRRLTLVAQAILTMTGRISMLGISRWSEKGGSYRTIQRFFAERLPWTEMLTEFFRTHLSNPNHEYILGGDATTVTKSGSKTAGIGRFFSGIVGKTVNGLEFFVFSLIEVEERKSYPLAVTQTIRSEAEKEAIRARKKKSKKTTKKKKEKLRGRPRGVLNKDQRQLDLSPELLRINELLKLTLKLVRVFVKVKYVALDGHFGHNQAVLMAQEAGLELVSKLRKDAAIFEEFAGEYSGKGRKAKYGERINYERLPTKYLKKTEKDNEIITNYWNARCLSKSFGCRLNVVIIEKINLKREKIGHAILFSSDLELSFEKLIEYYGLRFQIEFNFREAKQHFGLEDFMTRTELGVENAANMSFLMVLLSAKLMKNSAEKCVGVLDLKTHFRGVKYVVEAIKILLEKPETILMDEAIKEVTERISKLGSIHQRKVASSTA